MDDPNMQLLKQESSQMNQLLTEEIKIEEIFVCDGIIKQEAPIDEASINHSMGISNDNPIPDLDSFEDTIKTEPFLSMEIEDGIGEDTLKILPIKMEDALQMDYSISSGTEGDQSTSIVPTNSSSNECLLAVKEETIKKNSNMHKIIKKFSCNQCKYKSSRKGYLTEHVNRVHQRIKPFNCTQCDYKCSGKGALTVHINRVHHRIKPFNCTQCNYKCTTNQHLTMHVNAIHKCIKPFNCNQCEFKSSRKQHLTKHVNCVHKGIKPFNCNQCEFKCSRKDHLTRHVNCIHKGIKPFKCTQCDYKANRKSTLKMHLKAIHKGMPPGNLA